MGQILLLTMETFSQMGQMRGSTCRENTAKYKFIKWNIFTKTNYLVMFYFEPNFMQV